MLALRSGQCATLGPAGAFSLLQSPRLIPILSPTRPCTLVITSHARSSGAQETRQRLGKLSVSDAVRLKTLHRRSISYRSTGAKRLRSASGLDLRPWRKRCRCRCPRNPPLRWPSGRPRFVCHDYRLDRQRKQRGAASTAVRWNATAGQPAPRENQACSVNSVGAESDLLTFPCALAFHKVYSRKQIAQTGKTKQRESFWIG
jgi:hypothetical protein